LIREIVKIIKNYKAKIQRMNKQFTHKYHQCIKQLKARHTHSYIERAVRSLADGQRAGGQFYWPRIPGHYLHLNIHNFPQYHREHYLDEEPVRSMAIDPTRALAREIARILMQE
jgi:hypothetical protein